MSESVSAPVSVREGVSVGVGGSVGEDVSVSVDRGVSVRICLYLDGLCSFESMLTLHTRT